MKRAYTLKQLAHFNRCLYPGNFRDDLTTAGLDYVTADEVAQFIINKRRKVYSATGDTFLVGITDVYQEYINSQEIIDAIEQVVYDFCNS